MKLAKFLIPALLLALGACSGQKQSEQNDDIVIIKAVKQIPSIRGCWKIDNVVVNDTTYARPSEETPATPQTITFRADSTYYIATNCNSISGSYEQRRDTLTLAPGIMTEMACPNMRVEELLRQVLPSISSVDFESDSVARLNTASNPASYILLTRSAEPVGEQQ